MIFQYFEIIFEGASGKGFSKNKIHNWFCATLGQKLFESCVFYFCPTTKEERLATITYILGVAERSAAEVIETLDQKEFGTKSKVMSTLEQLLEMGRKEGRQQGQEVGKLKARIFNLLKTATRFPQMNAVDLADFTELGAEKVIGLFDLLTAADQQELLHYIQAAFLPEIKLSTEESTKLDQLVADLLDSRR
ncbi:MAG: hypothetical protein NXI25_05505 [bacterium]|nr:hypothetical protein [bacterium]